MTNAASMIATPLRAFSDNYIWCLQSPGSTAVAIVDPGDARPVLDYLNAEGLSLAAILVTHHHRDHTGGIRQLIEKFPATPVYGPARENIPAVTVKLEEGDKVFLSELDCELTVMGVPGHTAGHIAYHGQGKLFCGDTVFACGCGRVFDGAIEELAESLARIAMLPEDTEIYCAHEYTVDNIGFAKWVEPENAMLLQREEDALKKAESGIPTVPSTLKLELATNPFFRCGQENVLAAAHKRISGLSDYQQVFAEIRAWKDKEYD